MTDLSTYGTFSDGAFGVDPVVFGLRESNTAAENDVALAAASARATVLSSGNNVNRVVTLPAGEFAFSSWDWQRHHIEGHGAWATRLRYDGANDGTPITRSTTNNLRMRGVALMEGSGLPATWIDCGAPGAGDDATDWGDAFEDVFFGECSGPALITSDLVNLHMRRVRWDSCEYAVQINLPNGPGRVVDISQFTIDFTAAGAAVHKGFFKVVAQGSSGTAHLKLSGGRYEGTSTMQGDPAVVHVSSSPANSLNTCPVKLLLDDVAFQIAGTQPATVAVIHQDTTQTNVLSSVVAVNSELFGLTDWFSGSTRSGLTLPTFPGFGRAALAAVGGVAPGGTPSNLVALQNVRVSELLSIDDFIELKEVSSAPSAPSSGVRLYFQAGSLRMKDSSATVTVIAP